jgi:hypothetical protein
MSASAQAANPTSTLSRFLDATLPQREIIVEPWAHQLRTVPWPIKQVEAERAQLGTALEIRLGLHLADEPAFMELLSFLPPEQCGLLLRAVGFTPATYDHLPAVDTTTDPLLRSWTRSSRPTDCDSAAQRAALATCVDMAGIDRLSHRLSPSHAPQLRRAIFLAMRDAGGCHTDESHPAFDGLHHMWNGYLRHGHPGLQGLGKRVIIAPPLAAGFATADLAIGRALVEVKASSEPAEHFPTWLNQLLCYLLLDRLDVFEWDTIALYLGWHAVTLTAPVTGLLAAGSSGPTPVLKDLRNEFRQAIGDELDEAATAHLRARFSTTI